MGTLKASEIKVGLVASFDADKIRQAPGGFNELCQNDGQLEKSRPFVCISAGEDSSTWAEITSIDKSEHFIIPKRCRGGETGYIFNQGKQEWCNKVQHAKNYVLTASNSDWEKVNNELLPAGSRRAVTEEGIVDIRTHLAKLGCNLPPLGTYSLKVNTCP